MRNNLHPFLTLVVFLVISTVNAQTGEGTLKSVPFSLKAQLEPDYHRRVVQVTAGEFITLSKVKGTELTKSLYKLEKHNVDLAVKWSSAIELNKYENIIHLEHDQDKVRLFLIEHNTEEKITRLLVWSYADNSGKQIGSDTLVNARVKEWQDVAGKGSVKQDLVNAV